MASSLENELTRAKIRNIQAQADKTELKTRILRGEYVAVDDVRRTWADNVIKVRSKLLSLPGRLAGQLEDVDTAAAYSIVKGGIIDALNELAEEFPA